MIALAAYRSCGDTVPHVPCSARFAVGRLRAGVVPSGDALVAPRALVFNPGGRNGAGVSALGGDYFGGCVVQHGQISVNYVGVSNSPSIPAAGRVVKLALRHKRTPALVPARRGGRWEGNPSRNQRLVRFPSQSSLSTHVQFGWLVLELGNTTLSCWGPRNWVKSTAKVPETCGEWLSPAWFCRNAIATGGTVAAAGVRFGL